ncbi:unnamed protein product [Symbiodinium sp. CCMP2456]|nr:unnamed protein product [Symbiodinium sp. CCMP2456]
MCLGEEELPKSGLSYDWFQLEGLAERGASGRLIIAPGVLTRPDLDFNWDVIAKAMEYLGARPGVDQLQDDVELFFQRCKMKGRKPVTREFCRQQAWRVRNLVSMFNRICKLPHLPNEENIRKIYVHLGLELPPGRQPRSNETLEGGDTECDEVGYDEGVESEVGTEDEVLDDPEALAPPEDLITPKHAEGNVTTQETQVMEEEWLNQAAAKLDEELRSKEAADVAANVYSEEPPAKFGPKRLRTETQQWGPSKVIKKEPVPIKQEPLKEPPIPTEPLKEPPIPTEPLKEPPIPTEPLKEPPKSSEPVKEPPIPSEPLKEPPIKREPLEEARIKREPFQEPRVKLEPGLKHKPADHENEKPGHDEPDAAEDGIPSPAEFPQEDPDTQATKEAPAVEAPKHDDNDDADPKRPALLATAGVISPKDQKLKTTKKKQKRGQKEEEEEEQPEKTKPKPKKKATKDTKKTEDVPKRKPGRPRKNDLGPTSAAKPAKSTGKASPSKATPKKRKPDDTVSEATMHYSPKSARPKAKAKAKAKAQAKPKKAAKPSKDGKDRKPVAGQDAGQKSRKSCAYHKAKATALKEGCSKEEAATRAKKATWLSFMAVLGKLASAFHGKAEPGAVAGHFDAEAMDWQWVLIAVVMLLLWSTNLPQAKSFDLLDLFSGVGNATKYWKSKGKRVATIEIDRSASMDFLSNGGFALVLWCIMREKPTAVNLMGPAWQDAYRSVSSANVMISRVYPMEFVKQIYDAFTTDFAPHTLGCLRNKNTTDPNLSDVELFNALPMKDMWEDAELPSVYFYLRRNKYCMVPPSWEDAIHSFDKELDAKVNCYGHLREEYNSLLVGAGSSN